MIWVTGDLHGDISRLQQQRLGRKDTLIVAGDFGFLWKDDAAEQRTLERIGRFPFTTLFVDGTHENFTALERYPTTFIGGAEAHQLGKRLYHVKRGQIAVIENTSIFLMGGGDSPYGDDREEGVNWWPQESPTGEERQAARYLLDCVGDRVDYVVTHEPPQKLFGFMQLDSFEHTPLRDWLDTLAGEITFDRWYFGSLHLDRRVTPLFTSVFAQTLPLGGDN